MMTIQQVKQRFKIIGSSPALDHAIATAMRVAPTDLSVLITGESGTGKENFPKIIHQLSQRKHNKYIAVNCGAIPEGTIDSELFGHEKGSFTGAHNTRQGYFEVANGGTIFLDEVAELPLQTQVRLLRVLESGEFIKVGSSKVQKTDVRIAAATNVNIPEAIEKGKFREDLFYRLSTVPIKLPPLRDRKEDVHLLFRKFAADFAEKYRMPPVRLNEQAVRVLENYSWKGNIRQLKNVTEQISIIEQVREIGAETLITYLPDFAERKLPTLYKKEEQEFSERELLYKVLFDMKKDVTDLKKLVLEGIKNQTINPNSGENVDIINRFYGEVQSDTVHPVPIDQNPGIVSDYNENEPRIIHPNRPSFHEHEEVEESLSIEEKEKELIKKALEKYNGKRKHAARELGISERTLYRKINEYHLK
ncbi:sigma-54-dependent Fis family transcriptional regulator [bacterium SCSIO 12741]|nr:sigma-54-dependent Fis family transcriptional regulator [bacterium SCSIO 12741]